MSAVFIVCAARHLLSAVARVVAMLLQMIRIYYKFTTALQAKLKPFIALRLRLDTDVLS